MDKSWIKGVISRSRPCDVSNNNNNNIWSMLAFDHVQEFCDGLITNAFHGMRIIRFCLHLKTKAEQSRITSEGKVWIQNNALSSMLHSAHCTEDANSAPVFVLSKKNMSGGGN